MEIIDINCMVGPWGPMDTRFRDLAGLTGWLDRYHIGRCVAYTSTALWCPQEGNRLCAEIAAASAGRVSSAYVADPALDTSAGKPVHLFHEALVSQRPAAVRLYPVTNGYILDEFYSGALLEVLDALAMPVLLDETEVPLAGLPQLARRYPRIPFVLLRRGFRESRSFAPLLGQLDNIYLDTSMMVDCCLLEKLVADFGSERLLFGSGLPFYEPSGALGLIIYARIGQNERKNILAGNWLRLQEAIAWS